MKTISRVAALCVFLMPVLVTHVHAQGVRTIFLVRHADKISDAPDAVLSDAGHRRAACLAKTLADTDIQQIYTSDLQRTQQTAAPLAQQRQLKPVTIPLSKPDDLIAAIKSGKAATWWSGMGALFLGFCTNWALRRYPRLRMRSMTASLFSLLPRTKNIPLSASLSCIIVTVRNS